MVATAPLLPTSSASVLVETFRACKPTWPPGNFAEAALEAKQNETFRQAWHREDGAAGTANSAVTGENSAEGSVQGGSL
jgi:hypothetical protein